MAGKNTAVFGTYRNKDEVENAIDRLVAEGFRHEDISVLLPNNPGNKDIAYEKHTKAPEGTTAGVLAGGAVGGTLGLLASIGVIAIPGIGPLLAAGPIVSTLAGLGAGGTFGGIVGALTGAGIPEYEAKRYEGRVRRGHILVSVHSDNSNWTRHAKKLLKDTGAEHISATRERKGDFERTDRPIPRSREARVARPHEERMETHPREERIDTGYREGLTGMGYRDVPHEGRGRMEETRERRMEMPQEERVETREARREATPREEARMAAGSSRVFSEYDADFRNDFETRYARFGYSYQQFEPAYRFGSDFAARQRLHDPNWSAVESDARREWERSGQGRWEDYVDAIRYGWNKARGRHSDQR